MTFSSTDHVHDLERLLEPLQDAFAAIFFFWIGLVTDPGLFTLSILGMIVAAVVVTTPTKTRQRFSGRPDLRSRRPSLAPGGLRDGHPRRVLPDHRKPRALRGRQRYRH